MPTALDTVNRVMSPDAVMWAAAAAAVVLFVAVGPVRAVLSGALGKGAGARTLRVALILVIILSVALPLLLLFTGETVPGAACGCFLLFFPLFCYYYGKGAGRDAGRRGLADLIGLETSRDIEDAQDRLYESRLRIATRDGVLRSIAELTRGDGRTPGKIPDDVAGGAEAVAAAEIEAEAIPMRQ